MVVCVWKVLSWKKSEITAPYCVSKESPCPLKGPACWQLPIKGSKQPPRLCFPCTRCQVAVVTSLGPGLHFKPLLRSSPLGEEFPLHSQSCGQKPFFVNKIRAKKTLFWVFGSQNQVTHQGVGVWGGDGNFHFFRGGGEVEGISVLELSKLAGSQSLRDWAHVTILS